MNTINFTTNLSGVETQYTCDMRLQKTEVHFDNVESSSGFKESFWAYIDDESRVILQWKRNDTIVPFNSPIYHSLSKIARETLLP